MHKVYTVILIILLTASSFAQLRIPDYKNTNLSFEKRALDLVSRMTLEEKVSQLVHDAKAIERLNIPDYNWMNECLHGVAVMEGYATVFPQSIGMAASFNTELMYKVASIISDEARAMHHNGIRNAEEGYVCGLDFWSPDINLYRDPRWGRGQETYGEDPNLMGRMAVSFIKGLQGDHPKYLKTIATVKHYVVHSGPESKRHEFNTISNDRDFWETYMPHYITSIKEANVQSVMCAYSRLNGESCCGSDYLLNELLREQLGFNGYVVSDCGSVTDIYEGHNLVSSVTEAAVLALKSGVDLNCGRAMTFPYDKLTDAVNNGMLEESFVDTAAYRLMLARMKLGMFDPPDMVPYASMPVETIDSEKNKSVALEMARESIVLLKNKENLLPLTKDIKTVAVIGPNADDHEVLFGNYHGTPSNPVSVLEGVTAKLPNTEVLYSKGSELVADEEFVTPVPAKFLLTPDKQQGLLTSYYPNTDFSGEPLHTRIQKSLMVFDEFGAPFDDLEINNFSIRWEGFISFPETALYKLNAFAHPHYQIFIDDELIAGENKEEEYTLFERNKNYRIRIEFISDEDGFYFIFVHSVKNASLLNNALKITKDADAVILTVGISSLIEEESLDRNKIELPEIQHSLIKEVLKIDKPTVLVILGGGAIAFDEEVLNVPAIIEAWYPGQAGGTAVADVLFGDYNPAGRLPVTFYQSTSQLPPFEDYSMDNRTYKYFKGVPLFPFGYGMSYSSFDYSNFEISESVKAGEDIEFSIDVTNNGNVAGDEVIQIYVKDVEASVRVPVHSLQSFKRLHLKTGEKQTVTFTLSPKQLALLNNNMIWMVEPGEFIISVGGGQPGYSSTVTEVLSKSVQVTGNDFIIIE